VLVPDPLYDAAAGPEVLELDELEPEFELPLFFAPCPFDDPGRPSPGMFMRTYVVSVSDEVVMDRFPDELPRFRLLELPEDECEGWCVR